MRAKSYEETDVKS